MSFLHASHIDTVLLAGFTTGGCVRATCVDAMSYNFNVGVVADGCADRLQIAHDASLLDMDMKYGDVLRCSEALDYMQRGIGDPVGRSSARHSRHSSAQAEAALAKLRRHLEVDKSTGVHRLLATLAAKGFVRRDEATGLYELGVQLAVLGQALSSENSGRRLKWRRCSTASPGIVRKRSPLPISKQ